ncbi:MAG: alcohol dehydrogenase catalytic domain-containing protein [Bacteroidales bacterium]|nr:alcohol dehydrogenase catalytic domain-containing protein [Bacteroidales bacterium]
MRVAELTGIRELAFSEKEKPKIVHPDEVLMKIEAVGICGSDIHYYNEGNIGSQVIKYPFVIGHESAATVVEVGDKVRSVKPGDKVAIEPTLWCGECEQCKNNRRHTCLNQKFLGCPGQIEGVLKEYAVLPEKCCFPVSDDMPFDLAVFAEPLSVGIYAVKLSGIDIQNANIAVLGAGPIGQSVLSTCVKAGAKNIFVTDRLDYRLDVANKMGAKWLGNTDNASLTQVMKMTCEFDVVFECCGKQDAVDQAVEILKPGGKLMLIGIPDVDRISLLIDKMRRKELCFQNVRRQNECFQNAIDMINDDRAYFQRLITHHFQFENTKVGFDLVLNYADNVMKAIVNVQ